MNTPTFGVLLDRLDAERLQALSRETDGSSRTADLLQEVIGDVRFSADLPRRPDGSDESAMRHEAVPEAVFDDVAARIESAGIKIS